MQQFRKSNFSDVFCLNCMFVIDATVKHLISRSFLKCGVFAVTMAAHNNFLKKLNQIFISLLSLHLLYYRNVVATGGARPLGLAPGQRRSEETSQRWRTVGYSVSDLTGLGIEPKPSASIATFLTLRYNWRVC